MPKIGTQFATLSAEHMWKLFAKQWLVDNPGHTTKTFRNVTPGKIFNEAGKEVFSYIKYKAILSACNKKIGKKLITGYAYALGYGLGDIFVARVERIMGTKNFDRGESFKLRKKMEAEGKVITKDNWKVVRADEDDFVSTIWHKGNKQVPNIIPYHFKTAGGQPGKGYRQSLSAAQKRDPYLKGRYPLIPSKRLAPQNTVDNGL